MTMTTNNDKPVNEARELRRELIDDQLLDAMLASTSERGISLTGEGGFLPELIKSVLERGMSAELTSHLGYEKNDPAGRGSGNSRNGTTPKPGSTDEWGSGCRRGSVRMPFWLGIIRLIEGSYPESKEGHLVDATLSYFPRCLSHVR